MDDDESFADRPEQSEYHIQDRGTVSPEPEEHAREKEEKEEKGEKKGKGERKRFRGEPMKYLKREIHFTIEAPNGDQMPMRYKPDMTVETAFLVACKKFHISPHDHYAVLNNKELDRSEKLKNCSITQNSVVRLYRGKLQTVVPDIFVSIKIRDCRIGSVFVMTQNIWSILNQLLSPSSFEPEMVPVVIYQKTELIGQETLREVRLRDMGITSGSCVLKFLQLKQEDLDMRKMRDEADDALTLETLELRAAGPLADAGLRSVHFKLSEDELDSENMQYIGDRRALAFRLQDPETPEEVVQEEYFDLLVEEVASLFNELCKQKNVTNKGDLIDNVREQLDKLKEIRTDFEETMVRVVFPDRSCLQFLFLPEERIFDIKEFISKFLKDPRADYELSLGPPDHIAADDDVMLGDLKLVPTARLFYVPTSEASASRTTEEQYLSDDVILSLIAYNLGKEAGTLLRGESLEKFLASDGERGDSRGSSIRKSGFLSKFLRSSNTSNRTASSYNSGSRSKSMWMKKPSSFQPRSASRASAKSGGSDDDDDDAEVSGSPKTSFGRTKSVFQRTEDSKTSLSKHSSSSQSKQLGR